MLTLSDAHSFLRYLSETYGKNIAFQWYSSNQTCEDVTYEIFYEHVCNMANRLAPILGDEQRIAIIAENSYAWLVYYWAIMLLGKSAVLADPGVPCNESEFRLTELDVRIAFVSQSVQGFGSIREIQMDLTGISEETDSAMWALKEESQADKESTILFTTGTTGTYKGVRLSQKNIVSAVIPGIGELANTVFLPLPFYHSLTINGLITSMSVGCKICIGRGAKYVMKDLSLFEPDIIYVTPIYLQTFYQRIVRHQLTEATTACYFGRNLRYAVTGGASPQEKVLEKLVQCGIRIFTSYGSSETFCIASGEIGSREHYVGKVAPHMNLSFIDEEIVVSGPTVFMGYTDATQEAVLDGWYHTGDMGVLDNEGGLTLTGRKKNLIILSNGKNVSPEHLEGELCRIPEIEEAVVYGQDDKICAEIYIGQSAPQQKELVQRQIAAMNSQQPTYYQIQKVIFRDTAFDHSGIGKIKRGTLNG